MREEEIACEEVCDGEREGDVSNNGERSFDGGVLYGLALGLLFVRMST
jgi:hypothetical protein